MPEEDGHASATAEVSQRDAGRSAEAVKCGPAERSETIRSRVRATGLLDFKAATPLLPDRWPHPRGLVVFAYELHSLPTGRVMYEVQSPEWRVTVSPLGAEAVSARLQPVRSLGREPGALGSDEARARLAAAEDALVEVAAGCRTAQSACAELAAYRVWFEAHPLMARHLRDSYGIDLRCDGR